MAEPADDNDDVRIYKASYELKKKLGYDIAFQQLMTPQVIAAAQAVIEDAAGDLMTVVDEMAALTLKGLKALKIGAVNHDTLRDISEAAFMMKSMAGLCGYEFASSLAKSLHVFCESDDIMNQPLDEKSFAIIRVQVEGLDTIFANKVKGDGGEVGANILAELQKLLPTVNRVLTPEASPL